MLSEVDPVSNKPEEHVVLAQKILEGLGPKGVRFGVWGFGGLGFAAQGSRKLVSSATV